MTALNCDGLGEVSDLVATREAVNVDYFGHREIKLFFLSEIRCRRF